MHPIHPSYFFKRRVRKNCDLKAHFCFREFVVVFDFHWFQFNFSSVFTMFRMGNEWNEFLWRWIPRGIVSGAGGTSKQLYFPPFFACTNRSYTSQWGSGCVACFFYIKPIHFYGMIKIMMIIIMMTMIKIKNTSGNSKILSRRWFFFWGQRKQYGNYFLSERITNENLKTNSPKFFQVPLPKNISHGVRFFQSNKVVRSKIGWAKGWRILMYNVSSCKTNSVSIQRYTCFFVGFHSGNKLPNNAIAWDF